MPTLAYLKILQRAWDKFTYAGEKEYSFTAPRAITRLTEEQKIGHLNSFMVANKKNGTSYRVYETQVNLHHGNMVTYAKWLMTGRLNVEPGELIDFFTARWAANKTVKREVTPHV